MSDYISISQLNDFVFCPYSIYLHNVYMDTDEDLYHATPQTRGAAAHKSVDRKTASSKKDEILALPVFSEELGVMGKIDVYRSGERLLIERKYLLKQVFQGQIYQLWAQYFCMLEMGYDIEKLSFYEISTNRMIPVELPGCDGKTELVDFIARFRNYDPASPLEANPNKCQHCIYCNLCDKTTTDNVY